MVTQYDPRVSFALVPDELGVLDAESAEAPDAGDDDVENTFVPGPRDVAYYVRVYDAALFEIDQVPIPDDQPSLAELLATRDRALAR